MAMGLPIVTLPGEFMRGRQTMAMLKLLGVEELIATSTEEYLSIAHKLATNHLYRDEISQKILKHRDRLFDDPEPPKVFGQLLEKLVRDPHSLDAAGNTMDKNGQ
jgi:protein O-GlcNAc transferase